MADRKLPVPVTSTETKAMVKSAISTVLGGRSQSLGVSQKWLIKRIEQLGLSQTEVESLLSIRTEFDGSLVHATKVLAQGITVDELHGCYSVVRSLTINGGESVAVIKVAKLVRSFAEADPQSEVLDEIIAQAHEVIRARYFWVKYINQSIAILSAIAESYGCATIGAALSLIDSQGAKLDGVLPDLDEPDEVERHREDYEERRYSK